MAELDRMYLSCAVAPAKWRAVVYRGIHTEFVCTHAHDEPEAARKCAREWADQRVSAEPKKYVRSG